MSVKVNPLLGFRTHFSLGESTLTPSEIVAHAKEAGVTSFAVCDTMNVSCLVELTKKATKEGLRPLVGVRLRIVPELLKEKGSNSKAVYIKVFPRSEEGMQIIYQLLTTAFDDDHFYEVPRLTWDDLMKFARSDHLAWTTGDIEGLFGSSNWNDAVGHFDKVALHRAVELVPVNTPYFDRCNANAIEAVRRYGFDPILSYPALYSEGEYESFFVSLAIQKRSTISKGFTVWAPHNTDAHPLSASDLIKRAGACRERLNRRYGLEQGDVWKRALLATESFLELCPYTWTKRDWSLPHMSDDPDREIAKACVLGVKERLMTPVNGYQPTPEQIREEYLPRLRYELGVLKELKFATYFLVVSDVVNHAKSEGILVGPGRGSVGGSLVAYLMGITDVDPIRFGLLFERFINPSRNDLPDADLDFMSTRRGEVVEYIDRRFGSENVAGISNYGELGASSAMRDVARVFGHNVMDLTVSKFVPKVHGQPVDLETAAKEVPAIAQWAARHPDEWSNAVKLEGKMRSYGKHAAGVIVSGVPIVTRAVVEKREGAKVVNWNMAVTEDNGLVKLDILGLSTLDTLSRALKYIKERHGKRLSTLDIPLDDEKTLDLFATGKTMGVFQFEGGAARRILKDMAKVNPLTFDDLVAANALNRPGPIEAGLVKQYVDAKNGDDTIRLPHENMRGALEETYNVICYQEQVMRISVDLCGFELSEADKLRKIMGKKLPEEMKKMRDAFVDGAVSKSGMPEDEAGELFDQIEKFAGYAFNKSHAVEYSLISYQMAWIKAHYPVEFFAAALSTVDEAKLAPLVEEASKLGIEIMPPDINISTNEFVIATDTKLFIPFNRVKGISEKTGEAIIAARELDSYEVEVKTKVGRRIERSMEVKTCERGRFADMDDFMARVEKRRCNVAHVDRLDRVGAFHRIVPGSLPPLHEDRRRDQYELIPGLMSSPVVISRYMEPTDKYVIAGVNEVYRGMDEAFPKAVTVRPFMGKAAKFVAIFDAANKTEEENKRMTTADSFDVVKDALFESGLERADVYWTALVKKTKEGSSVSPSEVARYAPFLEQELAVLKPPLILALGTNVARYLVPDIKGSIFDYVGKVFYDRKRDANILIGFTPGMIYHDPEKQDALNEVFERAATLVT